MTNLWNIINTLRSGNYLGDHDGDPRTPAIVKPGNFDPNDPVMIAHLDYALKRRFGNTDLQGTALDIIRALRG